MQKLLITGASGFLGYHLIRAAQKKFEVHALHHAKDVSLKSVAAHHIDITNYIALGDLLEDIQPDAIIHAAAIADANFCQQNPEQSFAVNVEATKNLAGIASDFQIPFVFTSTDLVFDGTKGNYTEEDTKNPLNKYGEQKALAEEEVLRIYPEALVCRLSLMFGDLHASASTYIQKLVSQLKNGEEVSLFHDEYRSMCDAKSVSAGMLKLMFETNGLLHLAGHERLSRFDFGMLVADVFAMDTSHIKGCSQRDVPMPAPRPQDVSLNISKALALGYTPLQVRDELALIATTSASS